MRNIQLLSVCLAIIILGLPAVAIADIPQMINYQGRLTDTLGRPLDTIVSIVFTIYDDPTTGTDKWTETHSSVVVAQGLFNVLLGSIVPVDETVFIDPNRYLGIKVGADPELVHRTQLLSSAYAYHALYADTAAYAVTGGGSPHWLVADSILYTDSYWGIARGGAGNTILGDSAYTVVNLGIACRTGESGQPWSYQTVGGGYGNTAAGWWSTIGGGRGNLASGLFDATIGGGQDNTAGGQGATIGGGRYNTANSLNGTIGGGQDNVVGHSSTISGGYNNQALGGNSAIGGGFLNDASNYYAFIGGGRWNDAGGIASAIGGGAANAVYGDHSAILGGYGDTIAATAHHSFLFGVNSKLTLDNTFMVDMPHIRFGDETSGYEFPISDGAEDQVMATDGNGQLSWKRFCGYR